MTDGNVNWHISMEGNLPTSNKKCVRHTFFDPEVPFPQIKIIHTLTNVGKDMHSKLYTEALFKIAKD